MNTLSPLSCTHNLGLGCSTFGGGTDKKTSLRSLAIAYANGIHHFDVARSYGFGQAESIVGEFIRGKRPHVVITTKFGISPAKPFPFMEQAKSIARLVRKIAPGGASRIIRSYAPNTSPIPEVTPAIVMGSLAKSLFELKTDYVDIFLLHNLPYDQVIREDITYELIKAKEAGKIRAWGATCEMNEELPMFQSLGKPFDVIQHPYIHHKPQDQCLQAHGISSIIFSVMSQCMHRTPEPPPSFYMELPVNLISNGLVKNLREAWLYIAKQENPNSQILCSMTKEEHITRNLDIMESPLLSRGTLANMKSFVKAGKITRRIVISKSSAALIRPLAAVPA